MRLLKCDRCKCDIEYPGDFLHITFEPAPEGMVSNTEKQFEVCKSCHVLVFREIMNHAKVTTTK